MKYRSLLFLTIIALMSCSVNISDALPTDLIKDGIDEIDLTYYAHHLHPSDVTNVKSLDISVKHFKTKEIKEYHIEDLAYQNEPSSYCWTIAGDSEFYDDVIDMQIEYCSVLAVDFVQSFFHSLDSKEMFPHYFSFKKYYEENIEDQVEELQHCYVYAWRQNDSVLLIRESQISSHSTVPSGYDNMEGEDGQEVPYYDDLRVMPVVEIFRYKGSWLTEYKYQVGAYYFWDFDGSSVIQFDTHYESKLLDSIEVKLSHSY